MNTSIELSEDLAVREDANTGGLILECMVDDDGAFVFMTAQEVNALRRYLNMRHELIEQAKRDVRDN